MADQLDTPAASADEARPIAMVRGAPFDELPNDLYIPPDALEVFLETFEGPLDLLLYLIRRQNIDILDIPIAAITKQYVEYLELMENMRLELAAEYLVMAAWLAEIKSRMLLPRPTDEDGEEIDPRAELVRRLQEYERFKQAAQDIDALDRIDRDLFPAAATVPKMPTSTPPTVSLDELLAALRDVFARADLFGHHHIQREPLTVRERMSSVLDVVNQTPHQFVGFAQLFDAQEGRIGVVVTLLAILELVRESLIELVQAEAYAPLYVRSKT